MKIKNLCGVIAAVAITTAAAVPVFTGCNKGGKTTEIVIKVVDNAKLNAPTTHNLDGEIKKVSTLLERASADFSAQYDKDVRFKISEFESGAENKAITKAFGTADAADILYDGFFNMSTFIHTGKSVPLDGLLSAEAKADLLVTYLNNGKYDGKQYLLPYMASQNIMVYNKEMLRECGLQKYAVPEVKGEKVIAHWTMDEWTEILDTMAEKYLDEGNGKVPMMMYAKDNQGDTHIMTMLRAFGSNLFSDSDNFDIADDPAAIEALKWLQGGVEKGWYLPVVDDKTLNDNTSKFKVDELGFYNFSLNSPVYERVRDDDNDKYGFVNYPGDNCNVSYDGFQLFDNGNDKKLQIAKDFIRFFYESEKWLDYSASAMPASKRVTEKFKDDIFLLEEFNENLVNAGEYTHNLPNWQGSRDSVRNVFYREIAELLKLECTPEECARRLQDKLNAAIANGKAKSRLR